MEFGEGGSSHSFSSSSSGSKVLEKDLLRRMEEKNYENSGVDVSLVLGLPPPPVKKCLMCGDTETPLWRNGPEGRKTLCNACGIRYRKEEQRLNTNLTLGPSNTNVQANGRARKAR